MGNYVGANGFGVKTTAEEVIVKQSLAIRGKTVLVTGSNAGIGKATVQALARHGAHVIMACRDSKKMMEVKKDIENETPDAKVTALDLDLGDFSKILSFITEFKKLNIIIDVLVQNAGVMPAGDRWTTPDGFEYALGINAYGTHYFTLLMLPFVNMETGRIILVTSSAQFLQTSLDLEDIHSTKYYQFMNTYSKSKLCGLMFFLKLERILRDKKCKINCISVQPGVILSDLGRESNWLLKNVWKLAGPYFMKNLEEGCSTTVYACFTKDVEGRSGSYLEDCNFEEMNILATDIEEQDKLWHFAENEMKVKFDDIIQKAFQKK
jgi:WW domain-containing oxidoreductase